MNSCTWQYLHCICTMYKCCKAPYWQGEWEQWSQFHGIDNNSSTWLKQEPITSWLKPQHTTGCHTTLPPPSSLQQLHITTEGSNAVCVIHCADIYSQWLPLQHSSITSASRFFLKTLSIPCIWQCVYNTQFQKLSLLRNTNTNTLYEGCPSSTLPWSSSQIKPERC